MRRSGRGKSSLWLCSLLRHSFSSSSSISCLSSLEQHLSWLGEPSSKLSSVSWDHLRRLQKNTVRNLIPELTNENELGFKPYSGLISKGTLVDFVVQQKRLHPEKVILVRVGEVSGEHLLKSDSISFMKHMELMHYF